MIRLKVKFDTAYFIKDCLVGDYPMRVISSQMVTQNVIEIEVPDGQTEFINSYATNIEVLSRTPFLEEGKVYKCKNNFYYKCISENGNTKLLRHDNTLVSTIKESLDALDLTEFTLDNFISAFCPHISKMFNPLGLFPNVTKEQAKILALFI